MGDVISIPAHRKPVREDTRWRFNLSVYDGPEGLITEFNDEDGLEAADRLRDFARMLDVLSFLMKQQAEEIEPGDDGHCLAQAHIYENSRVVLRVDDHRVTTDDQREWIKERLEDAKGIVAQAEGLSHEAAKS